MFYYIFHCQGSAFLYYFLFFKKSLGPGNLLRVQGKPCQVPAFIQEIFG